MYNAIPTSGVFLRFAVSYTVLKYYCISFNMYTTYKTERDKISCKAFSVES